MSTPPGEPPQEPSDPPGPGWQAPQPGWGQQQPNIPNHLVWSILTTIFCCLPFGIVSIVHAAQVDSKVAAGDVQGAMDASNKARTWAIVAAGVGGVFVLGWIALVMFGIAAEFGTF